MTEHHSICMRPRLKQHPDNIRQMLMSATEDFLQPDERYHLIYFIQINATVKVVLSIHYLPFGDKSTAKRNLQQVIKLYY